VWGCVGFGFPHRRLASTFTFSPACPLGAVRQVVTIALPLVSGWRVVRRRRHRSVCPQITNWVTTIIRVIDHNVYHMLLSRSAVACCSSRVIRSWLHLGVLSLSTHTLRDLRSLRSLSDIIEFLQQLHRLCRWRFLVCRIWPLI
jgi:hypothetical protein